MVTAESMEKESTDKGGTSISSMKSRKIDDVQKTRLEILRPRTGNSSKSKKEQDKKERDEKKTERKGEKGKEAKEDLSGTKMNFGTFTSITWKPEKDRQRADQTRL